MSKFDPENPLPPIDEAAEDDLNAELAASAAAAAAEKATADAEAARLAAEEDAKAAIPTPAPSTPGSPAPVRTPAPNPAPAPTTPAPTPTTPAPAPTTPAPAPATPTPGTPPAPTDQDEEAKKIAEEAERIKKATEVALSNIKIDPTKREAYANWLETLQKLNDSKATDAEKSTAAKASIIANKNLSQGNTAAEFAHASLEKLFSDDSLDDKKRSAFLGIVLDEFKFLGEKKDSEHTPEKELDHITGALKRLSINDDIKKEKSLAEFFTKQSDDFTKTIGDKIVENLDKTKDKEAGKKDEGMSDADSKKFELAKSAVTKAAQIAAVGALAATGGIFAAAILAGALYWWHTRNAGKEKASKQSEADIIKEQEDAELADFEKRLAGKENTPDDQNIEDMMKAAYQQNRNVGKERANNSANMSAATDIAKGVPKGLDATQKAKDDDGKGAPAAPAPTQEQALDAINRQLQIDLEDAQKRLEVAKSAFDKAAQRDKGKPAPTLPTPDNTQPPQPQSDVPTTPEKGKNKEEEKKKEETPAPTPAPAENPKPTPAQPAENNEAPKTPTIQERISSLQEASSSDAWQKRVSKTGQNTQQGGSGRGGSKPDGGA